MFWRVSWIIKLLTNGVYNCFRWGPSLDTCPTMRGWFDAFRSDGGPTLYSYSNRTPVTGDVPTISLYVLFFTLFIAFVIIFPGVRKEVNVYFWNIYFIFITHSVSCVDVIKNIMSKTHEKKMMDTTYVDITYWYSWLKMLLNVSFEC